MPQEIDKEKLQSLFENAIKEQDSFKVAVLSYYHKAFVEENKDLFKQIEDLYIQDIDPKYAISFLADYKDADEDKIIQNIVDQKKVVRELYFLANKLSDPNYDKIKNLILTYGDESDIYNFASETKKDIGDFIKTLSCSNNVHYSQFYIEKLKTRGNKIDQLPQNNAEEEFIFDSNDSVFEIPNNFEAMNSSSTTPASVFEQIFASLVLLDSLRFNKYPSLKKSYEAFTSSFYEVYNKLTSDTEHFF